MERSRFSLTWFLFSFEGRIGRAGYWAYTVVTVVLMVMFVLAIDGVAAMSVGYTKVPKGPTQEVSWGILIAAIALALVYCWTNYAVLAKRWHDRGKSGWWSLIGFIPYVGGIWILVECGFLKGNDGPNAYGHGPNGQTVAQVFE